MMLTAIPTSHSSSVFAHNHAPTGGSTSASMNQSVVSPDSSPEAHHHHHHHHQQQQPQQDQHAPEGQTLLVGSAGARAMNGRKVPLLATGQVIHGNANPAAGVGNASTMPVGAAQPQLIPVHQSFILGTGATAGYILPSLTQLSSLPSAEGTMVGIQHLNTLSSRPMSIQSTSAAIQPPSAAALGYYGQVQSDTSRPLTFQPQISSSSASDLRVVVNASIGATIPSSVFTRAVSSPQQQVQQSALHLSQHHHPNTTNSNTIISSGLLPRTSILNSSHQSDPAAPAPPTLLPTVTSPGMEEAAGVPSLPILSPPQQQPTLVQPPHSLIDKPGSSSGNSSSVMSPNCSSPSSDSGHRNSNQKQIDHHLQQQEQDLDQQHHPRGRKRQPSHDMDIASSYTRSRAARQATRFGGNSLENSMLQGGMRIKREPEDGASAAGPTHLLHSVRRNSESNLEEAVNSSSKSYQISALIDVPPMVSALNRASRTSSPCSSISSIRFGGSLNQLNCLPPHISIGKIHDMKSTG